MTVDAPWYQFQPGDIIVCQTGTEWGVFKPLFKWLVGDYGHAMLYAFDKDGMPYFVEARPKKGVSIVSGKQYNLKKVVIMRAPNFEKYGKAAAQEALDRASDPSTVYGFNDIITCVVKLVYEKLGRPIARWVPNKWTICSELVWECYATVGLELDLRTDEEIERQFEQGIPLPGEFITCGQLEKIFEGELVIWPEPSNTVPPASDFYPGT